MKKKGFILGALLLIGVSSLMACENEAINSVLKPISVEVDDQLDNKEEPKDSIIEFLVYGELMPVDYLSSSDSISIIHGFKLTRVSGCSVTSELTDSVSKHNAKSSQLMTEKYGENWKKLMESKIGKRITFNK
mgnify:FL=1